MGFCHTVLVQQSTEQTFQYQYFGCSLIFNQLALTPLQSTLLLTCNMLLTQWKFLLSLVHSLAVREVSACTWNSHTWKQSSEELTVLYNCLHYLLPVLSLLISHLLVLMAGWHWQHMLPRADKPFNLLGRWLRFCLLHHRLWELSSHTSPTPAHPQDSPKC